MPSWLKTWPHGRTWVFQGTVAEDATGGTHVCSLTVTPGAGNELEFLYGMVTIGNTATAQTVTAVITDGTNNIGFLYNAEQVAETTASLVNPIPGYSQTAGLANTNVIDTAAGGSYRVSGTMSLILRVTTTAISVTQTFAVACRLMGALPTATLADSVGTPVLTTNTNQVFG